MTCRIAIDRRSYNTWRMRLVLTIASLAALAFLPGHASAYSLEDELKMQHPQYQGEHGLQALQGGGMSLSEAIEMVRRRTGGQIISAETKIQGGREVHHIKVLKDGKVKTHKVNGRKRG